MKMKVYLGADHGGFEVKNQIGDWLKSEGYEVEDKGAVSEEIGDDFVDYAELVAQELQQDIEARGILFCRNGVGMSMAANRYMGVRCALGFDTGQVERARTDDDVNCLSVPADYLDIDMVEKMVETFLKTEFSGKERYKKRLSKLAVVGGAICEGGVCVPKYAEKK